MADALLDIDIDITALLAALRESEGGIEDLKEAHQKAAKKLLKEWQRRIPVRSGKFRAAGRARATQRFGITEVTDAVPYAGVAEFGGKIPRFQGNADHKSFTLHKPPARSIGKDSYFLYPARDAWEPTIVRDYQEEVQRIVNKHIGT